MPRAERFNRQETCDKLPLGGSMDRSKGTVLVDIKENIPWEKIDWEEIRKTRQKEVRKDPGNIVPV